MKKLLLKLKPEIHEQIKKAVKDSGIRFKNVTHFIQTAVEDKLAQK
jgi:hypothetical protein